MTTVAPVRLAIVGAAGRMGQRLVALAGEHLSLIVAAEVDAMGPALADFTTSDIDVVIDFSVLGALQANSRLCAQRRWGYVAGTTGLGPEHHSALDAAAEETAVLWAPNFSVGVNTVLALLGQAAKMLGSDFDLEVIEAHHRKKVDAPSGTARALANALVESRGWSYDDVVHQRPEGLIGARPEAEVGMSVVRGGSVVGEHTVLYLGPDEQVSIGHRATNRDIFARGALRAAQWLASKGAGRYTMANVLS